MRNRAIVAAVAACVLAGCGSTTTSEQAQGITFENCGQTVTVDSAERLYVNDGNIISMLLAVDAQDKIIAASSLQRDLPILEAKYGDVATNLPEGAEKYPSLEEIIAKQPDMYVAGWGYGFSEGKNITPDTLAEHNISSYLLTESCKQADQDGRGTTEPWEALRHDLTTLGKITGNDASDLIKDIDQRLETLRQAPKADKTPVGFLFDSGSETIFTSGKFGAPQTILEAAGAANATADVEDTWTQVGWETVPTSQPDFFVFVEYPGQTYQEKVDLLKSHPATKDLPAVKEEKFINLPYSFWTSGPMNIDAAEFLRKGLESYGLQPESTITTKMELPADFPGQVL